MLKMKSCPRCQGDMVRDADIFGEYEECIQCGCLRDIETPIIIDPNLFREPDDAETTPPYDESEFSLA